MYQNIIITTVILITMLVLPQHSDANNQVTDENNFRANTYSASDNKIHDTSTTVQNVILTKAEQKLLNKELHPLHVSLTKPSESTKSIKPIKPTKFKHSLEPVVLIEKNKYEELADINDEIEKLQTILDSFATESEKISRGININTDNVAELEYWKTVYSIESKQGKLLYRPRNKAKNCNFTHGPCGHHQLTVKALVDIGCTSMQCRKDRLDYNKSLKLSKKLLVLNKQRLKKHGIRSFKDYEKYLIHQQGANGIKNIIAAAKGKKQLSNIVKKNMANNSPYSYRELKKMNSKTAAIKFMQHWKKKWHREKRLALASSTQTTDDLLFSKALPTFNDNDFKLAFNIKF